MISTKRKLREGETPAAYARRFKQSRESCDCGRPAVVMKGGERICQHCFDIDIQTNNTDQKRQQSSGEGRGSFGEVYRVRLPNGRLLE